MKHVQLREAKAKLSEVVTAVAEGEPVTITRHGVPVAVLVPVEEAAKLYPRKKTFAEHLLDFPGPLEIERDTRPPREIDL